MRQEFLQPIGTCERMRLLFINRYFYPDISATAQLLTELTEDLAAQGETVTVITGNTAYTGGPSVLPAQETYKGIRILRVGFSRFGRTVPWADWPITSHFGSARL